MMSVIQKNSFNVVLNYLSKAQGEVQLRIINNQM